MKPFLAHCAEYLDRKYDNQLSELCVVFPSRRAGVFFKTQLAKTLQKTFFAPEVLTSEDWIQQLAGIEMLDPLALLFECYEVYKEQEGTKAKPFDDFVSWAPTLLDDFSEVDQYLLDAPALFGYLNESYALQTWNVDGRKPTEFQQNYLHFWQSLGHYYKALNSRLNKQNKASRGLAYRIVAEGIEDYAKQPGFKKTIFIGFNALNASEEKIMRYLVSTGQAELLWDTDDYYMQNRAQEAGDFLRSYHDLLTPPGKEKPVVLFEPPTNHLTNDPKEITVIGVPQNVGQTKYAGELLKQYSMPGALETTALVLADETLLVPMLYAIPQEIDKVNVTMGYPIKNSLFFDLFDSIIALHDNARKYNLDNTRSQPVFYHQDIIRLLSNPFIKSLCSEVSTTEDDVTQRLIRSIRERNLVFLDAKLLFSLADAGSGLQHIEFLFAKFDQQTNELLVCFDHLVEKLKAHLVNSGSNASEVELELLFAYSKVVKRLLSLLGEHQITWQLNTFRSIFNQLVAQTTVPFFGEPLRGLQLMGILETRVLDFDTVILLSTNEGFLPSGKKQNSFIPFDVKRAFGLPLYSHRDAIFSYHFYRLLQRASKIYLLYNTETTDFNSGEKSRFITQLLQEMPAINNKVVIKEQLFSTPLRKEEVDNTIVIPKTPEVQERLGEIAQIGFSPSSLSIYKNCSLQFYFHYVARLRQVEEVEENIEAPTLGSIMHKVLEELYKPHIGQPLKQQDVVGIKNRVEKLVRQAFLSEYSEQDIRSGKNLLMLNVVQRLIHNWLETEVKMLEETNFSLIIQALEQEMKTTINIGEDRNITLKGKVDRIDLLAGNTRILDYKTGKVENKELMIEDWNELLSNKELNKAFQLLAYAYLYQQHQPMINGVTPGIVSFRHLGEGVKFLKIEGKEAVVNETVLREFEQQLKILLQQVYDFKQPFVQTEDYSICEYCNFMNVCQRG